MSGACKMPCASTGFQRDFLRGSKFSAHLMSWLGCELLSGLCYEKHSRQNLNYSEKEMMRINRRKGYQERSGSSFKR